MPRPFFPTGPIPRTNIAPNSPPRSVFSIAREHVGEPDHHSHRTGCTRVPARSLPRVQPSRHRRPSRKPDHLRPRPLSSAIWAGPCHAAPRCGHVAGTLPRGPATAFRPTNPSVRDQFPARLSSTRPAAPCPATRARCFPAVGGSGDRNKRRPLDYSKLSCTNRLSARTPQPVAPLGA